MQAMIRRLLHGILFLVLAGCGSGGGSGSNDRSPPVNNPPPPGGSEQLPTPIAEITCSDEAPEIDLAVELSLDELQGSGGGTLFDCQAGVGREAKLYLTRDSRFRIVTQDTDGASETLSVEFETFGNEIRGHGSYFYADQSVTNVIVDAAAAEHVNAVGTWSADWGSYGTFSFAFDYNPSHPPIGLAGWPADWDRVEEHWSGDSPTAGSWHIEPDGSVTGTDEDGCNYTGQFDIALASPPYSLTLTIADCPLQGDYLGIGEPSSGPFNDRLYVNVDDGVDSFLEFFFLSR